MIKLLQAGFLRLPQIIGQNEVTKEQAAENIKRNKGPKKPRPKITPIIPVSRSSWWAGMRSGRYPASIKLSKRTTAWRCADILDLCTRPEEGGK